MAAMVRSSAPASARWVASAVNAEGYRETWACGGATRTKRGLAKAAVQVRLTAIVDNLGGLGPVGRQTDERARVQRGPDGEPQCCLDRNGLWKLVQAEGGQRVRWRGVGKVARGGAVQDGRVGRPEGGRPRLRHRGQRFERPAFRAGCAPGGPAHPGRRAPPTRHAAPLPESVGQHQQHGPVEKACAGWIARSRTATARAWGVRVSQPKRRST